MAMEIVPLIIGTIAGITDTIMKSISNSDLSESAASMTRALKELTEARKDLETQVEQAKLLGRPPTNQVKGWMERVASVEAEVGLIIEKAELVWQRSCCCNCDCSLRYKLIKKLIEELFHLTWRAVPNGPTIGLDVMLERVHQLLMTREGTTLGLYGMGGVGKTTLLKRINNELTQKLEYDVVIWAVASKDFVVEKIQQAVVERLGLSWDENDFPEQRAVKIYNVMRKKKFLLLLDDIWERIDLLKLGIPLPDKDNKCNVVFTTRSMDVCSDMDADNKIKIEFLGEEEAWSLFCQKVGRYDILSSQKMKSYAKTIVRKCGGLPLAIVTMGRVMANKETEEEWQYAIEVLNETPTELRGMEDVFTLLKFSYQSLNSDTLRLCFMYCTLFPEDYSIEIEQLIEYWVGEEILDNSHEGKARNMGHTIIRSLKVACLLEAGEVETQVKMHDVVRSFALWMASECGKNRMKYLVQPSAGLTEAPGIKSWEGAQRIALWDNEITELPEVLACPHLLTLLLQWNSGLSRISNGFFRSMPSLRVLDLSYTSLREIPESICELVHYSEYENEAGFTDLECLSHLDTLGITITESYTLKRLAVSNTLLRCLTYLYITECEGLAVLPLSTIPENGKRLRRLSVNNCRDLMYLKTGPEDGKNWLPSLEVLSIYRLPCLTVVWKNPIMKGSLQNLRSVSIWYCDKLKNISWILQLPKLEMVYLFYCKEIVEVISGDEPIHEEAFPCLRAISLRDLPLLTSIAQKAIYFPCLQSIAVINCPKLTKLPLKVSGNSPQPTVYGNIEWWNRLEWDTAETTCLSRISNWFFQSMPSLRVLNLSYTSLREIPESICELVELRHLDLSHTKLTTLPKQLGKLQNLRHLDLQRTYLRTIPREAINRLFQVRVLNLYYSYETWEVHDSECENEAGFTDLECLSHLDKLGITITESHTLIRLAVSNTLLRCLTYLYITECEGLTVLPLSTIPKNGKRLRRLSVNRLDVPENWTRRRKELAA
ncbi:disease resistance protein RPS2 [Artemisia annua]|uniref:Disease resistance protein RPS2 n=1 Tax=Artemisia annua TaxID=35608 RepID=A0A2U1N599_ARTAN|nr:disease resistance protein RPS2 [Artemisia annua]